MGWLHGAGSNWNKQVHLATTYVRLPPATTPLDPLQPMGVCLLLASCHLTGGTSTAGVHVGRVHQLWTADSLTLSDVLAVSTDVCVQLLQWNGLAYCGYRHPGHWHFLRAMLDPIIWPHTANTNSMLKRQSMIIVCPGVCPAHSVCWPEVQRLKPPA